MNYDSGSMDDLMQLAIDEKASDLHLHVGSPPILRIHGALMPLDLPSLAPADTETLMGVIANETQLRSVADNGGVDFGLSFKEKGRFRVSVFRERGNIGIAMPLAHVDEFCRNRTGTKCEGIFKS